MRNNELRKKARQHLVKARGLMAQSRPSYQPRRESELISAIRATRELLWEERLASRS